MRVICPACGCNLEPVPGVPLGVVACPDCGKRIDLRQHAAAPEAGDFKLPAAPVRPTAPAGRTSISRRPWVVPSVAVAAVCVAASVVSLSLRPDRRPTAGPAAEATEPWDRGHRADLLSMKAAADALALRGELRAAYDGYNRVLSAAADHGVTDPVAVQVVAAARVAQDAVFAAMVRGNHPDAITAVPPATSQAVAVIQSAGAGLAHGPFDDRPVAPPSTAPVAGPATVPASTVALDLSPADVAPPLAQPPPPPRLRAYTLPDAVTDAQIGEAIERAIAYLRSHPPALPNGRAGAARLGGPAQRQQPPPAMPDDPGDLGGGTGLDAPAEPRQGATAPPVRRGGGRGFASMGTNEYGPYLLATYALLHAAQATDRPGLGANDPAVKAALDQIKLFALSGTYSRSLRAAALAVHAREEDRAALEADVAWLVAAQRNGGYTYGSMAGRSGGSEYDNSNSQYGLLGVWSGAQAGVAVPRPYWDAVDRHWTGCESPSGTWGYTTNDAPYLSMTLAGVASLLVTREYLDDQGAAGRASTAGLDAGLNWLDAGDNCVAALPDSPDPAYALYGLERVGLASGYKYFGRHDWYGELAAKLVAQQRGDGSWAGGSVPNAYCLLFLSRGRHPILYNKLRYPGDWDDRRHDVAHLARFAARQLERPVNWQVVNLRRNWFDWMDSPVLYIAGDRAPQLADRDYAALRDFTAGGGLIFTHADGGSPAFTAWVRQLVRRIYPKYELVRVAHDHPLYTVLYRLTDPPPLEAVSNGSRLLLVHCPTDIAGGWQLNWSDEKAADFQLGLNVFIYAAGKTDFKNRLASTYIPAVPGDAEVVRPVARLRFAGEWDPEPYAWTRFARYFQWETRLGLDVQTIDLKSLAPGQVPIAVLTGTVRQDFLPSEAAAARAFVQAGGVLLIDACGGQAAFDKSVRTTLLPAAFPGVPPSPLSPDHPLLVPSRPFADDLRQRLPVRPYVLDQLHTAAVPLEGLRFGKGWVIYSHLDLTTGLLGTQSWGTLGYEPAYAHAIVKNAVLWALARAEGPRR